MTSSIVRTWTNQVGRKLYLSEEQKDVVFLVGPDDTCCVRFPAHKLFLLPLSSVFTAMFSKKFKEGETGQVRITDVTPAAFRNLLQFAYTGKLQSPSVATCKQILYAADKYLMSDLTKFCFAYLENIQINLDNIWNFLNIVNSFYSEVMSPKLVTNVLQYLDENAESIFVSDAFKNLNHEMVSQIITRSSLKVITEEKILLCVFQWAKFECCRQSLEVTEENKRKVLMNIKYAIRYLLIPRNVLLSDTMTEIFLTQDERNIILDGSLRVNGGLPLPWNNDLLLLPRGLSNELTFNFDSRGTAVPSSNAVYTTNLLLIVSNDCIFESFQMNFFPETVAITFSGDITDLNGNVYHIWTGPFGMSSPSVTNDYYVVIDKPICLQKNKAYKLSLVCVKGHFVTKYNNPGYCTDASGKAVLFFGDFPTNAAVLGNLKSSNFCEKVLLRDSSVAFFNELSRNSIVKSVTIKI